MPETEVKAIKEKLINTKLVIQSWIHSRKALLFLVTFTIATVALFTKVLTGDQWITIVRWAVPAYIAGNVADGAVAAFAKKDDSN